LVTKTYLLQTLERLEQLLLNNKKNKT